MSTTSGSEVVAVPRFRKSIPEEHCQSLDTRLMWLWHQRFGTVQTIYINSGDLLDRTACTLIIQAIMGRDLTSIGQLLSRLEGGSKYDSEVLEETVIRM